MSLLSLPFDELRERRSLKWRTYAPDVLPMWVAEMDTALHPAVRETLLDAIDRGDTGYPHGTAYAESFARMAAERWQWMLDVPAQVHRAGDVMNSMLAVLEATTAPGDGIVINPPVYPPFRQVVAGYRRNIVEAPLTASGRLDLQTLEAAFAGPDRPKAYLLCSPHNPTGAVHTAAELEAVLALAATHGVRVIVDEIHACLVDPGTTFVPALAVRGGEQAISVTSAGKAWNLAGFKAGLIVAGAQATDVLAALPPLAQQSSGHLANLVHTAALEKAQDWVDELMVEIAANKALLATELARELPGARYTAPGGTYLAWVDCSELGLENPARHFEEIGRVAFSPGVNFGKEHQQWVRINLACSPELVVEGVRRMASAC
ncbi:MAG TPA: aminotransferase class I/II-fold pyridoxal phosphate-dependent enzyme [Propionicimonas sp.]|nr:aminotransferase class I/II-fold pyridoxal phosphate-dependent enzyme [Propionicimonas sp.]